MIYSNEPKGTIENLSKYSYWYLIVKSLKLTFMHIRNLSTKIQNHLIEFCLKGTLEIYGCYDLAIDRKSDII